MSTRDLLEALGEAAVALLAPPCCAACAAPLRARAGPLCATCRAAMPWLRGRRCARCGLPGRCGSRCPLTGGALERAWTPVAFEGPARAVVHALKLRGALGLAELMAAQIVAGAPPGLLSVNVALVPVPAAPARARRRGFDHAARIADAVGRRSGQPVVRCLRRAGPAPRQARAGRRERLAPGRVAVTVRGPVPAAAVLVDDVHTTGATLQACARALRAGGCRRVAAVAYARALR